MPGWEPPRGDPPQPGHHPADADLLHPRRHPRRRHLRPHRPGRGRRGRRHLVVVPALVPARPGHRLRLPGAGDQVPAGRRGRPVRPPGLPRRHPQLHGHHRGDGLGRHLGLVRRHQGRRPLLDGRVRDREPAHRAHRHPGHPAGRGRELPRRGRVDQGQHRHHPGRAVGPDLHHPGRGQGPAQRRREPRPGVRVQGVGLRRPHRHHRRRGHRLLRLHRLRGLGQHGRGGPRPGPVLPAVAAHRHRRRQRHLPAGRLHRGHAARPGGPPSLHGPGVPAGHRGPGGPGVPDADQPHRRDLPDRPSGCWSAAWPCGRSTSWSPGGPAPWWPRRT